jgi:non-ribosomal peptide synthetase component E (peptide arylation enzyme)
MQPLHHWLITPLYVLCNHLFIAKRFELELYFRLVEEHQITEGAFVPPMVAATINSPLKEKYSLKSIRLAHGGAAPLDKWSQGKLQELLHPDCPSLKSGA